MKRLLVFLALCAPALQAAYAGSIILSDYIDLTADGGLCGHFSLKPARDTLGNSIRYLDRIKLVAQHWAKARDIKKMDLGETFYRPGEVYSFGAFKNYRVYCHMRVPQGYVVNFDGNGQPQIVPEGTSSAAAATVQIQISGAASNTPEMFVPVPCNKFFMLDEQSTKRSCLSPLARQNKGNQELNMKD